MAEGKTASLATAPADRLIGMLLERLEAVRELHDSMRVESDEHRKDMSSVQVLLARLVDKLDVHERADTTAFTKISECHAELSAKLDTLSAAITHASTAGLIQKAQLSAGWKTVATIGAIVMALFGIFSVFFNHRVN